MQFNLQQIYSTFKNKQVLITGGVGLIGSNLTKKLVSLGAKVTLVDSLCPQHGGNLFNISEFQEKIALKVGDVRDTSLMRELIGGQNFIFNLAGQTSHLNSMLDPHKDLSINVEAQLAILEICRKYNTKVKIIFTSTRQVYGKPEYLPVDEKHLTHPVDVNGINKIAAENYYLLYNSVYNIKSCILRLTNTYGIGMRVKDVNQNFLGIWIKHLIEGKPIQIFGNGEQLRDFNYVDDVVEAILLAALSSKAECEIFNLGSLEYISLKDLAELLINICQKGSYIFTPFPDDKKRIDIGDYYGDYNKITRVLGWSPQVSLVEGLTKTLLYYGKYHEHYWKL